MVAVCAFSKWVELVKLPSRHPKYIATWFERELIARFGVPRAIRSDNGKEFGEEFD